MEKIQYKICSYFNGRIIGSYLFVKENLLLETEVNDIDIIINSMRMTNVRQFLLDNGYEETEAAYARPGYQPFEGNKIFIKNGEKPIHILDTKEDLIVFTIPELIAKKYDRGTKSDIIQIKKVLENTKFNP